jgi:general L-amino acid transport system substrate-binding protein
VQNQWYPTAARFVALLSACLLAASCAGSQKPQTTTSVPATSKAAPSAAGSTLSAVKRRGHLLCGANVGLAGFGADYGDGQWRGLDVDFCRAVASAIFGDATKVEFVPLTAEQRFVALQRGDVDVLARNSVYTLSRDSQLGLDFAAITFYDGQGFLVAGDSGFAHADQLAGASVCVQGRTTAEANLGAYSISHGLDLRAVAFNGGEESLQAFAAGRCDVLTADTTYLAAVRTMLPNPASYRILPERISKEPLAPVARQGDNAWTDILRWTHFAMLAAEEKGITAANVEQMRQSNQDPEVRLLLGTLGNFGPGLGLGNDWAYNIIKEVGNYAEVFERNVGTATPLGMARDQNALWKDGGLQFSPPIR